jgi:alkanesulfonate monooxygenase SsuD/methylene tetrahydromethanopterin reductase-like flavin-dependent oxidoreductase (luciferase family)
MPDRGRALEFGVFVDPRAGRYPATVQHVVLADRLGLDVVGLQDHPYLPEHLDMWTLLVDLAARTSRIRVFPDVASLPLRFPAVLAKAAASLDVMSGGRVDLGLGAGGSWDAIAAMGAPRRTPGEAVAALEEAVEVVRAFWSGERGVRAGGRTYALSGVHPGPVPGRRIEIWIGALGPRMLDLTGRSADGWLPSSAYVPPADLAERNRRIDDAAEGAGRDPADVRRLYNLSGTITDTAGTGFLQGPAEQWVEELTDLVLTEGMDTFVLWPHGDVGQQVHRWAELVVPAVREEVAQARRAR